VAAISVKKVKSNQAPRGQQKHIIVKFLASNQQHELVYFLYAVLQHRKGQWVVREPDFTVVVQATTSRDEVLKALDKLTIKMIIYKQM
jgi:hypothetical protein